jgi:hypothetical protein
VEMWWLAVPSVCVRVCVSGVGFGFGCSHPASERAAARWCDLRGRPTKGAQSQREASEPDQVGQTRPTSHQLLTTRRGHAASDT